MKRNDPDLVTGIAWYRRDQWPKLRKVAADADTLEESYDDWLGLAQKAILDLARQGIKTERVDIDVDDLVKWCRQTKRQVTAEARAEFTTYKLESRE